jgi:hypothetical protein
MPTAGTSDSSPRSYGSDGTATADGTTTANAITPHTSSAPRANEVSATPSSDNILPDGSRRERQRSRRMAHFAANTGLIDNPLSQCYITSALALTVSSLPSNSKVEKELKPLDAVREIDTVEQRRYHRENLQQEPRTWSELKRHPFYRYSLNAAHTELRALLKRGTFREIERQAHYGPLPLL